ncbi:N-acetyltransferase [Nocardioides caeni]|uniref:N-acetyltransferase n=1 Tax=Nocardioides caeni TaxID=574700 RepID=A0A4S8MZZ3_9ACTN|nr:N-acetyltransferase [Nocardioides caeni]
MPETWAHPTHVAFDEGHHLRPMGPDDVDLDLPAVHSSRDRLWTIYGPAWGWPPVQLTREADIDDLAHHAAEIEAHESFLYGLFDTDETVLLGCLYVDPPAKVGADADISWWVIEDLVGSEMEARLDAFAPRWIAEAWPLTRPRYVGRDLTWAQWLALPDLVEETA